MDRWIFHRSPALFGGFRFCPFVPCFHQVFPGLCILSCGSLNVSLEFRPEAHLNPKICSARARNLPRVTELILDLDEGVLNALSSSFNTG